MYKLVILTTVLACAAAAPAPGLWPGAPVLGSPLAVPHVAAAPLAAPWAGGLAAPWAGGLAAPWGHGLAAPWGHGLAAPWGHGLVGAPLVGAPVVKTALPVATSYANTVRIASPVVAAPALAHGPVLAPAYAHGW